MKVTILQEASFEFDEAISYYHGIDEVLGLRFKALGFQLVEWIEFNPEVLSIRAKGYRRANFKGFPYYIPYVIREDTIWILAFAHAARKPHYWAPRLDSVP